MRGGAMATPPNLGHVAMFAYIKRTLNYLVSQIQAYLGG